MDLNYYFKHFKNANTVIIKEPLKKSIINRNSKIYRFIALLNTLEKALKIFFTKNITRRAKKRYLLPN